MRQFFFFSERWILLLLQLSWDYCAILDFVFLSYLTNLFSLIDWLSIYKWGIIELILSDFDWFICSKKIPSYLSLLIYPINFVSKVVGWLQSKFLKLIMSSAFLLEISNNFAKSSIFLRKFLSRSGLIKEARTLQSICVCCSVYLDQNEIKLARI